MAHTDQQQQEEIDGGRKNYDDLIAGLPSNDSWGHRLRQYRGSWYRELTLSLVLSLNDTFKARPSDIILVSQPKAGTTWLKALAFSILNRRLHPPSSHHHPLLTFNPHQCVPFLEYNQTFKPVAAGTLEYSPRLIALHNSYSMLPASVHEAGCKIIYLARDPKDTLVSHYHFLETLHSTGLTSNEFPSFDQAFELYCSGVSSFGPAWEHQLEYWHNSMTQHARVMFLKYEEMTADTAGHVKLLAEFMGCGFDSEEEEVVEEIVGLCSFERLSNVKVNQEGDTVASKGPGIRLKNSAFFRKGKVGDWRNHMSTEMAKRMDEITKEKFQGSGLSFPSC